jgi:hypothetical protein
VQQGEGVGRGAPGGYAVAASGLQVGRGGEAGDVGGPGGSHRGEFLSAAGAHLDARPVTAIAVIRDAADAMAESWL